MPEQIDEQPFKEMMYGKHKEHFDLCYNLLRLGEESLPTYNGFTGDHYQSALVLIFPRAYKSFDSIRRLCEIASCEDAAVILRCLLNLLVVTRWISLDPEKRAGKYLAWYWVEMHRQAERHRDTIPAPWVADIQSHFKVVRSQFEYKDPKGKTVLAKHWYQPEAHSIYDLFKEVGLEKQYEEGYKPLSGTEHSDAMAHFPMVAQAERKGGERRLEVHSDLFLPHYLRNAFQYFADIFAICNKAINLADGQKLQEVTSAGITFYRADMHAKGIPS